MESMKTTNKNLYNFTQTNEFIISIEDAKSQETTQNLYNSTQTKELIISMEDAKSQKTTPIEPLWRQFHEHYPPVLLKKVVAEIIATYLLVFVTCGSAALSAENKVSQLGASIAGGLIVTIMIYAVGHISGAHMNPAVTLAFASIRQFPWKQVPFYVASQLAGAISAAFTLRVMLQPIKYLGTTSPSGTLAQALVMETVVTFLMMFIASAVTIDTKARGEFTGIAVGSAVCITSILAGPVSGGSMNPARTIGPALASNYYDGIWVYVLGPVSGALLGAWSYNLIQVTDKPVQAIPPHAFFFKLHRLRGNDDQKVTADDPLNSLQKTSQS